MERSEHITDEALQARAAGGDPAAEEELIGRYGPLVRAVVRPYFLAGGESEDLIQEGMIGLVSAIRSYRAEGGASFRTYAALCVRRRVYSALRASAGTKTVSLDDCLSLEAPPFDTDQANAFGRVEDSFRRGPEDEIIDRENASAFWKDFLRCLSKLEAQIMDHYLKGMSYQEIASKVRKPPKAVDNAVQRVRKKLTRYLNSGDISHG